ncbi:MULTISPECIES: universal stress protein UspE [unclassified Pseudoalteromonas]|uniref:universal stress protein UspE n=1 Tax=unclassified Pseudoalteromonas TaxID=194690 RepID=UPI000CF5E818|nr:MULTISPECIES: universal stress protein UspE [unclassified Pseudoalteromonas]
MDKIKRILAVVDPSVEAQQSLSRAAEIARNTGANITAFLSIYDFSYEMTTMLSGDEREAMRRAVIADKEQWLQSLAAQHQDISFDTKVVWHNRPFEAIIREVLEHEYDLVIKGTHQHHALKSVIFTPTDWHLIRKCPTPLLLVKDHKWLVGGAILAAVNASSDDEQHQALSERIIKDAQFISKIAKGDLHLVNAYPATPVNIAIEIPEFNPSQYNETVKEHHLSSTRELGKQFGIPENHQHVEEGLPEDVLPRLAEKLDSELVVIGTVGRTGLSAALVGNTAEHVIDSLDCDVLALKPDGYRSPLED